MENYRLYSFVNFYLSSIQQGVQTAHLVAEMFTQAPKGTTLVNWAKNDKTIIILNGGAAADIKEKFLFLTREAASASWAAPVGSFSEDEKSLSGTMTCCGIVVPERIWSAVDYKTGVREGLMSEEATWAKDGYYVKDTNGFVMPYAAGTSDHNIITLLKSCGLAR